MLNSVNEAVWDMKKFIVECNQAQEEMKKERKPKLRELIERLYKNFLKEERDDEAIQEMKKFIEECDKAQEEMNWGQQLKLKELIERLDNFREITKEEDVSEEKEAPVIDKRMSDIKKAAQEVASR